MELENSDLIHDEFLGFLLAIHFRLFNIGKGIFFLITALFIYNFGNYRLKDITHNPFIYNLYMLLIAFLNLLLFCCFKRMIYLKQ